MSLIINSQFRPFTFDEMIKPLALYKETYDKLEQDYSDLTTQAEMWKDIVNKTNSPEAYAMYRRYTNDLNSIVNDFSKGLNPSNRRALLNMKRRYAQDIDPIAKASEAMKEANDLRDKMGPDAIFQVSRYNSLDNFLHGKTANNKYQTKSELTKRAQLLTETVMANAFNDIDLQKYLKNDAFLLSIQHNGGSYEELMEALKQTISDDPIAKNKFSQIRQSVLKDSGYEDYDSEGQQKIINAVNEGLYYGLDKPVKNLVSNPDHVTTYQRMQYGLDAAKLSLSRKQVEAGLEDRDIQYGRIPIREDKEKGIRYYVDRKEVKEQIQAKGEKSGLPLYTDTKTGKTVTFGFTKDNKPTDTDRYKPVYIDTWKKVKYDEGEMPVAAQGKNSNKPTNTYLVGPKGDFKVKYAGDNKGHTVKLSTRDGSYDNMLLYTVEDIAKDENMWKEALRQVGNKEILLYNYDYLVDPKDQYIALVPKQRINISDLMPWHISNRQAEEDIDRATGMIP